VPFKEYSIPRPHNIQAERDSEDIKERKEIIMSESKIYCSADEYAWLENHFGNARRILEVAKKAKPGSAISDTIPAKEREVSVYEEMLASFEVRPGSTRSGGDDHFELSPEFQAAFENFWR